MCCISRSIFFNLLCMHVVKGAYIALLLFTPLFLACMNPHTPFQVIEWCVVPIATALCDLQSRCK